MKKIAFCFLIYDTIYQEELWNTFFQGIDTNKYSIYIHYKHNRPLKYFERHKLNSCIPTDYADASLIHAHNLLFKTAYEDGCDKMISLSQSCIPLKPFDHTYDFLTSNNFGHFNVAPQQQCFPRCDSLLQHFERNVIQKSSEWFVLNRKICKLFIDYDKDKITNEYTSIYAPEEHFFITNVFHNNLQDEIIITPNLSNDATTFTNWQDMQYKYPSKYGLKIYNTIAEDEALYLLHSKCLFGRKFTKECDTSLISKSIVKIM